MTRAAVKALGLSLFAPSAPSAAATAVLPPEGVDSGVIVKELKRRFAAIVTNGQGEMKGKIFRIAHIGLFDYMDTIAIIAALEQVAATESSLNSLPRICLRQGPRRSPMAQVYADLLLTFPRVAWEPAVRSRQIGNLRAKRERNGENWQPSRKWFLPEPATTLAIFLPSAIPCSHHERGK
jgi:hypothetical protein